MLHKGARVAALSPPSYGWEKVRIPRTCLTRYYNQYSKVRWGKQRAEAAPQMNRNTWNATSERDVSRRSRCHINATVSLSVRTSVLHLGCETIKRDIKPTTSHQIHTEGQRFVSSQRRGGQSILGSFIQVIVHDVVNYLVNSFKPATSCWLFLASANLTVIRTKIPA